MAKRLRTVCDLPWAVEKLRVIPSFEFENWAVIALGGILSAVGAAYL
jgi:hypothetical protein